MKKILIAFIGIFLFACLAVQAADLVIESKTQTFNEGDSKIKFSGDVKVSVDSLRVEGQKADVNVIDGQKLDTATFYDKPYAYEIKKNKKREVKANILKLSLITKVVRAEGDSQSIVFEGQKPIVVINADVQEYNTKTGVMTATGAVTIMYKELETFSNKAIIKTNKNGDLKDLELIGNARLKQQDNESFADRFYYDDATKIVTATGNTTTNAIMENGDKLTLKSARQEYTQNTNTFNASGDVKVWYQDYFAQGPKIAVYPDKTTKKPNEIYFVGRSSITQGMRTIYADKIRMILKPKDFHAEGNTRTVIKNIGGGGDGDDEEMTLGL